MSLVKNRKRLGKCGVGAKLYPCVKGCGTSVWSPTSRCRSCFKDDTSLYKSPAVVIQAMKTVLRYEEEWAETGTMFMDEEYLTAREIVRKNTL